MAKAIVTLAGKGTGKRHDDCKMNINDAIMKACSPRPACTARTAMSSMPYQCLQLPAAHTLPFLMQDSEEKSFDDIAASPVSILQVCLPQHVAGYLRVCS